MNLETAGMSLEFNLSVDKPTFIWGGVGVGKSSLVHQISDKHRHGGKTFGMVDFRALLRDPVDLRGLPTIIGDKAVWLAPDDLPNAERDGEEGILFMDELNAANPTMQAACFGLVLDRKVGNYRLPDGWRIVAAGNRQKDRAAAQKMPSALANRFNHIEVEPDVDTFVKYALARNLPPELIAFLRFRPALLHAQSDNFAFPTPRSWEQGAKAVIAPEAIRLTNISGDVGEAAAGEFEGFLRVYKSLPSIDSVIMDPDAAIVPPEDQIAARYAIVSAIAGKATMANFDNILRYAGRMPREFETMLVVDATRRDTSLTHTQAFAKWTIANQDVTM